MSKRIKLSEGAKQELDHAVGLYYEAKKTLAKLIALREERMEVTQDDVKKANQKIKRERRDVSVAFVSLALFQIGLIIAYGLDTLPILICIALMILPIVLLTRLLIQHARISYS